MLVYLYGFRSPYLALVAGVVAAVVFLGVFLTADIIDPKVSSNKINLLLLADLPSFLPSRRHSTSPRSCRDLLHPVQLPLSPPALLSKQQLLVLYFFLLDSSSGVGLPAPPPPGILVRASSSTFGDSSNFILSVADVQQLCWLNRLNYNRCFAWFIHPIHQSVCVSDTSCNPPPVILPLNPD